MGTQVTGKGSPNLMGKGTKSRFGGRCRLGTRMDTSRWILDQRPDAHLLSGYARVGSLGVSPFWPNDAREAVPPRSTLKR